MSKKQKTIRIVLNSVLLAVLIAFGVTVYQSGLEGRRQQEQARQELQKKEQAQAEAKKEAQKEKEQAKAEEKSEEQEEEEPMVDVGTANVEADIEDDSVFDSSAEELTETENPIQEENVEEPVAAAIPNVNFTEETLMVWPLAGDVLLDYSMNQTIYHPTLDVYKYNPGIVIAAAVESPVLAAANGTVTTIQENAETGTTVTMDMGNGYQAVYGQLQNVAVAEGQTVGESTILGYVAPPTKYYSVEGSNLYFAMLKDGQPIDPITYLP